MVGTLEQHRRVGDTSHGLRAAPPLRVMQRPLITAMDGGVVSCWVVIGLIAQHSSWDEMWIFRGSHKPSHFNSLQHNRESCLAHATELD